MVPLVLGGCGAQRQQPEPTPGSSDRWHVFVSGPRGDESRIEPCLKDAAIDEAIQTLDLPSTHLGIKLQKSAGEEDARRIAECLTGNLESGEVSIGSPARR